MTWFLDSPTHTALVAVQYVSAATAKAAATDVFTSGNIFVDTAVRFTFDGITLDIGTSYSGSGVPPTTTELDAISEVWATLVSAMAGSGASAAPEP